MCYIRLDLAVSNNKTQQTGALNREQLPSLVYKTWWCGVPSWYTGFVPLCTQGTRLLLCSYSSSIPSVALSLVLPDDILHIPAGGKGTKERRGRGGARAVSYSLDNCHAAIPLISYWPAFSLYGYMLS